MVDTLVTSGIEIYAQVSSSLLPTPLKPHYVFNLRDLSKFFLSLMKADPQQQTTQDSIVRLWTHECLRVYHDRLVETDRPGSLTCSAQSSETISIQPSAVCSMKSSLRYL